MSKIDKLAENLGNLLKVDVDLASLTTLKIGGKAKYFVEANSENILKKAIRAARTVGVEYFILAGGSDVLINDSGFDGLVIHVKFAGIEKRRSKVFVKAGEFLQNLVDFTIRNGLPGVECMAGIPGTVGGAVYGNAGAYGQTISDYIKVVKVFDGRKEKWFSRNDCKFSYRESIFKKNHFAILEAEFEFEKGKRGELEKKSREILALRKQKYPDGLRSPGSFFKNVLIDDLDQEILNKIPPDKIMYGKIPAGYLLEMVGAKNSRIGDAQVASYHGNLFLNVGQAKARDFLELANKYKEKVKEKFGIELEPEVQIIGFN